MNRIANTLNRLFLLPLCALVVCAAASGCSDDGEELQGDKYGYVQFKLYKKASYNPDGAGEAAVSASRAAATTLGDVRKIEIELRHGETSITQTLVLNAFDAEHAEFGMRSDKLQLLAGDYRIMGYKLLDKIDGEISGSAVSLDDSFTVVPGGLTVKELTADLPARGMVRFRLFKQGLPDTRAAAEEPVFLFSTIRLATITVRNTFSQQETTFEKLKVDYREEYEEHTSPDNPEDHYRDIGTARCDTLVWLPAGEYRVVGYTIFSKSGSLETTLDVRTGLKGEAFTVEDNRLTEDAPVPVQLSAEAAHIKDYRALRAIWEALGGPNWKYQGEAYPAGANWNFNKEIDMWGDQPGVSIDGNGRVTAISFDGFGATGVVPDAIGQLTELRILSFGSHAELVKQTQQGNAFFGASGIHPDMSAAEKQLMRRHYYDHFIRRDSREDLSEMLQWVINRDPQQQRIVKSNRTEPKDVEIGKVTNGITAISKAVMRLTRLQQLFIANSPIEADRVFTEWQGDDDSYRRQWADEAETWSWSRLTDLTDLEIYNCQHLTELPAFLRELPELQVLNLACNKGIADMGREWSELILHEGVETPVAPKLQMIYLSYTNLPEFPQSDVLRRMKKLGMIDCIHSGVRKLHAFGPEVRLVQVTLDNNEIEEIPADFCGFTNETESLSFAHNRLTQVPDIFDAQSIYVMGSVNFSGNRIGEGHGGKAFADGFKGINASEINLSDNRISVFPSQLFATGSPISTLNLSQNLLDRIEEGALQGENAHLLSSMDLRFNRLSELPDDFRATTIPYLRGFDISYNRFAKFPTNVLNCYELQAIGIRYQRDAEGNRILRDWPTNITTCPSLLQLQIGSNDIRRVDEQMTAKLWIVEVKDNPNISLDVTSVCPLIEAGMWMLIYDKTQDIRGCDALGIER